MIYQSVMEQGAVAIEASACGGLFSYFCNKHPRLFAYRLYITRISRLFFVCVSVLSAGLTIITPAAQSDIIACHRFKSVRYVRMVSAK